MALHWQLRHFLGESHHVQRLPLAYTCIRDLHLALLDKECMSDQIQNRNTQQNIKQGVQ